MVPECDLMEYLQPLPHTPKPSGLTDLPYDLILCLLTELPADDVIRLLSICRKLRGYIKHESIWRDLCSRFGIRDLSQFPGRTYFGLYTSLLHTYGPLLGLWASDFPFRGNIMEFRILTESSDWQGIIGEIWRFTGVPNDRNNPTLPSYWQFLQIRLPELPETTIPKLATLSWFLREEQKHDWVDHRLITIDPTLHVFSPTTEQVVFFWHGRNPSQGAIHPDFGEPEGSPWYDESQRLPRLRVEPSVVSNPNCNRLVPSPAFGPALASSPGQIQKPKAISILLPYRNDPSHLYIPLQPFPDIRHTQTKNYQFPSRYYPLRFSPSNPDHHPILTNDPNEAWPPSELEGLWLGSYGPHGTEVLYLHSSEECWIDAWKVTGDVNVPRGVMTWRFNSRDQTGPESIPPAAGLDSLPASCRIFRGSAHVCGTGFIPALESWIDCIVVVFNRDDIKVYWESLQHTSRYRRYNGRDISLETVPNENDSGIRVAPAWD